VRQLAERTAQATGKIEAMISGIQEETDEAVASIEQGQGEVQAGIELADQAGDAFEGIVNDVESVANQVDSIAAATEEQSTTSEQISQNVENISTVSTEAAKGVNEVAQSATQLDALTEDLATLLDQFDLGQEGHDSETAHSEVELRAEIESPSEADPNGEGTVQV
jgi:methyl-accepting chemotaxis protein